MLASVASLASAFAAGLRPEPDITVSEWADKYRIVAKPSPEPGPWRTSRVPYAREIMDRLSPSDPCEIVVLMKAAQGAGTEIGLNAVGCWAHRYPDSTMIVQPTVDLAKKFSRIRFDRIVEATPVLREIFQGPRTRAAASSVFLKEFGPGRDSLIFTGANSEVGLRSYPSRFGVADEIDGYPADVNGLGDPMDMFIQRTGAFRNRKIFILSTPTTEEVSSIAKWYKSGDQNKFNIPCPLCGWVQPLIWGADRARTGEPGGMRWPKGSPDLVRYQCEKCGDSFEEWRKVDVMARGEWIPGYPMNGRGKIRSYQIWAAYYPYGWPENAWSNLAAQWETVHQDPVRLKTFVNLKLGEPWKDPSEAKADADSILARCEAYGPELPAGVAVLNFGADVQANRIEVEIVGWGKDEESWSIDYRQLLGDTTKPQVWEQLDELLQSEYLSELGITLTIKGGCVDAGYNQEIVRKWCHERAARNIWAIIGKDGQARPVWPLKMKSPRGKKIPPIVVGVDVVKEIVYARLKIQEPGAGFCHFPVGRARDYFEMLTSEIRVPDYTGPSPKYVWRKRRASARNESLDARGYAYAHLQGLSVLRAFRLNREVEMVGALARARKAPPQILPDVIPKAFGGRNTENWLTR